MLQEALGIRPHVLVLNKMDLADPRQQPVSMRGAGAGRGPVGPLQDSAGSASGSTESPGAAEAAGMFTRCLC